MSMPGQFGAPSHGSDPQKSYPPVPHHAPGWQGGLPQARHGAPPAAAFGAPPQPPKKKAWWAGRLAVGVGAGIVGLAIGMTGNGNSSSATAADPMPTVTITAPAKPAPTVTVTAKPDPAPAANPVPEETKTAEPAPKPVKAAKAEQPSSRDWAKVVKSPDKFTGKRYVIYGEVKQFDSATGADTFLADTAHRDTTSYGFFDGENTMLTGSADKLEDLVEGDVFRATVSVTGSFSYDTQIGGNTTVPLLQIETIKVVGQN